MTDIVKVVALLKEVRDSPNLGESSNAVVVSGNTWQKICDVLDRGKRANQQIRSET